MEQIPMSNRMQHYTVAARVFALGLVAFSWAQGQGTTTREKPEAYPSQAVATPFKLAAEFFGHSMPSPQGVIFLQDYLVVEVAAYPPGFQPISIRASRFSLRLNGKKSVLVTQSPGMVAASVKYPDWTQRPRVVGTGGLGDGTITVGEPTNPGRFPGDPNRTGARLPAPVPRVPDQTNSGVERQPEMQIEEVCERLSLPEDVMKGPRSGYLFFPYSGKLKSLHSIELLYEDPESGKQAMLSLH